MGKTKTIELTYIDKSKTIELTYWGKTERPVGVRKSTKLDSHFPWERIQLTANHDTLLKGYEGLKGHLQLSCVI